MNKTMKLLGISLSVLAMTIFATVAFAHEHDEKGEKAEGKTITVKGEVVDVACYTEHGAKGEKHEACAEDCIKTGQPAGIVDAKGNLYIVLGKNHKAPAEVVKGVIAKQVTATGELIENGGSKFLVVSKIEESKGANVTKKVKNSVK